MARQALDRASNGGAICSDDIADHDIAKSPDIGLRLTFLVGACPITQAEEDGHGDSLDGDVGHGHAVERAAVYDLQSHAGPPLLAAVDDLRIAGRADGAVRHRDIL